MAKFTDINGVEWRLGLTVNSIDDVQQRTGIDLYEMVEQGGGFANKLCRRAATLVNVLWILCEKQAEEAKIDAKAFGYGFDGPTIADAVDALQEAMIDFFHRPTVATALKAKLRPALKRLEEASLAQMDAKIEKIIAEQSGGSPASVASTPAT